MPADRVCLSVSSETRNLMLSQSARLRKIKQPRHSHDETCLPNVAVLAMANYDCGAHETK